MNWQSYLYEKGNHHRRGIHENSQRLTATSFRQEERHYRTMKIAIATDTNSGITAMEGEKLGVFVLAMPVNVEETIHYEGIDITSEQLYDAMRQHRDVSTSQPSPGQLMELWDGILAKGL